MTSEPITMPEQVGFDQVCQTQKPVPVEGLLHIPESASCSTDEWGNFCTVQLTDLVTRSPILLRLPVAGEREEPVPNHMLELSIPYEETDFMVAAESGGWVGEGSMVRVTALAEPLGYNPDTGYDCRLVEVTAIEKLERFTLPDAQARQATLRSALKEGWVEISITGDGLSQIDLKIEPKINFHLNLEIEQGTIFLSDAAGVQNMVVRKQSFVYVTQEAEAEIELDVSCANMSKKEPGRQDTFTVLPELAPQELIALLSLAEFAFEPMRIQQFSVWTITDNPAPDGYVGLKASFSSEGSGPTEQELARIRELFLLTGLDTANYKALQE
jgi:hypothetical protein